MRCTDLGKTWGELEDWFDQHGILVLPIFRGGEPLARLDDDIDTSREATPAEVARVLARLRTVVERFEVKAVYVRQTSWDADSDWAVRVAGGSARGAMTQVSVPLRHADSSLTSAGGSPTRVTVRLLAGGVVHELLLVASWYAALEESAADLYATIS